MAANLTALIVDDEPLARQELQYLLEAAGDVTIVAQGSNGIEAVELIRAHKPDVIFLDVRMPGMDGFAVLKKALSQDRQAKPPQVVFATAFDQYAVKAFEVNAVDYLLKPFDSKRVVKTLEKVRARMVDALPGTKDNAIESSETVAKLEALLKMLEGQATATQRSGKVVVRTSNRLLPMDQKDVCFATIDGGIVTVVTKSLKGDTNFRALDELEEQLDPDRFWRAHRSYLVNVQHIREVVPWFKSTYQLRMDDKDATEIPVSRTQTKRLRELFNL